LKKLFLFILIISGIESAAQVSIKIDLTKEKEPISKYIYGQFIEHLGNSIYNGLWSEMILDRKFFFPVTDKFEPWGWAEPDDYWGGSKFQYLKASPWKVIGAEGTVTIDSLNPYVGKYSPQIHIPGNKTEAGISHPSLTIETGKKYTGYFTLSGESQTLPVIIRLVVNDINIYILEIKSITSEFVKYHFSFIPDISSDNAKLEILSSSAGTFRIGVVSLMPADNINGWRKDVVHLLKQLNSPIYRWPGGNFVSGYNWRDGIGEIDKRPPRKNPAWTGIEPNDVGIHEFMNLMNMIKSEVLIAINLGLGTIEEAAAQVEYCNGSAETAMGKLRSQNGHPEPYSIKFWAVGNEMYGPWQLGYIPVSQYINRHNQAAEAMWKIDSTIQLIGVGSIDFNWSETMMKHCGENMNLLSEHTYVKENTNLKVHINSLSKEINRIADVHRKLMESDADIKNRNIKIALDEYNYWYGPNLFGEIGVRYYHKDALGIAKSLHELFRNSDIYLIANYAQTVNALGCIKVTPKASAFETTALPLILYRNHYGEIPIDISGNTSELDIVAALSSGRDTLTIAAVNSEPTELNLNFSLIEAAFIPRANKWSISHNDPMAFNNPGDETAVSIQTEVIDGKIEDVVIPGYSIVVIALPLAKLNKNE
jgi:alpha-L-arabinofuranosidase